MKKIFETVRKWRGGVLLALTAGVLAACSDDNEPPAPDSTIPAHSELLGGWEAEGYRWDLDNGKSACYLMNEAGDDFAYDEAGNYITLTVREYCEQYARDYNADPKKEIKGTPEDFADHAYEGTAIFTNFNITENHVTVYLGQYIPGVVSMYVLAVSGDYTYDPATGVMTVRDVANETDLRTLLIDVKKSRDGRMHFRYPDYDTFTTPSYDQTKTYYVYAPMIFYCVPGEPFVPEN